MNKNQIEEVKRKINTIIREVCDKLEKKVKGKLKFADFSTKEKIAMIRNGKSRLKPDAWLRTNTTTWDEDYVDVLIECCIYEPTVEMRRNKKADNRLNSKLKSDTAKVREAGELLIDKVILDIIAKEDIPNEYKKLTAMSGIL